MLIGKVDKSLMSFPRSFSITYPTPQETTLGTPQALPTSEPGAAQISYTIGNSDLPVFNFMPSLYKWCAFLYGAGKNTNASSRTVYWKVLKNGNTVQSGSSTVATNNYFTLSFYNLYDVTVGDVIELKLWADAASVDWRFKGFYIVPTRVAAYKNNYLLSNIKFSYHRPGFSVGAQSSINVPLFCVGSSSDSSVNAPRYTSLYGLANDSGNSIAAMATTEPLSGGGSNTGGTFRASIGDSTLSYAFTTHASSIPYYSRTYVFDKITFTPTVIKV